MLSGRGVVQHHPLLKTENHCEKPKIIGGFSDRSHRNSKSHQIWVLLEAIFGVFGPPSQIGLKAPSTQLPQTI